MFCKKKSDFKSWGGQFNTMSPPIKKLGGTCPQYPPPCYAPGYIGLNIPNFFVFFEGFLD